MEISTEHQRKRIDCLDVAKGIGMILVVLGHANPPKTVKSAVFSFHMALFFIISGMVYRKKRHAAASDLLHLVLPYAVTVGVVLLFQIMRTRAGMSTYYDSVEALLQSAWFGSGTGHGDIRLIGEIWFLMAMFWSRRLMDGLFCIDYLWARALCAAALVSMSLALATTKQWFPMSMDVAPFGVCFMLTGWLIANKTDIMTDEDKLWPVLLACLLVFWVGCTLSHVNISSRKYGDLYISLPTAVAGSLLTVSLSRLLAGIKPIKAFLAFIGKHTLLFLCITSVDWRMPFSYWGASLIAPYAKQPWFWVLGALRRFSFDFAVMCAILLLVAGARRFIKSNKSAA